MTLRCTIEIVPHGIEEHKSPVCRLDISNTGVLRDNGFGHVVCKYDVKLWRHNNLMMRQVLHENEWILEDHGIVEEHDRRDGALELVRKATEVVRL